VIVQTLPASAEAYVWKGGKYYITHCVRQAYSSRNSLPLIRWQEVFTTLLNKLSLWSKKLIHY